MCSDCRPEFLDTCYRCGHRFREYESYYIVHRRMDQDGAEHPHYGVKYGRCQDCPRDSMAVRQQWVNWADTMGEYKKRGGEFYWYEKIVWY